MRHRHHRPTANGYHLDSTFGPCLGHTSPPLILRLVHAVPSSTTARSAHRANRNSAAHRRCELFDECVRECMSVRVCSAAPQNRKHCHKKVQTYTLTRTRHTAHERALADVVDDGRKYMQAVRWQSSAKLRPSSTQLWRTHVRGQRTTTCVRVVCAVTCVCVCVRACARVCVCLVHEFN